MTRTSTGGAEAGDSEFEAVEFAVAAAENLRPCGTHRRHARHAPGMWRFVVQAEPRSLLCGSGSALGPVATLSAPGFPTSTLTMRDSSLGIGCTIKWGDGSTTTGDVAGNNATGTHLNSLYTIFGVHTYRHRGAYHGIVIVSNSSAVRAHFTVIWP